MVFKSGVKFDYKQNLNFNKEIMEFLNFIIALPEEKIKKGKNTLYESFFKDFETLFKRVEDKDEVDRMKIFKKKNPEKFNEELENMFKNKSNSDEDDLETEGINIISTMGKKNLEYEKKRMKYENEEKKEEKRL